MAITLSTTGYCQVSDVQALMQQFTIGSSSDPNTTEVEAWITEDFGEINSILRASGYAAPVAQMGGSLAVSAGSIVVKDAATRGSLSVTLQGSGGTLSGSAIRGDFLVVTGDAQRYMVTEDRRVNDSGEITLSLFPRLEKDAAAGAAITYTQGADAAVVLKKLNALMTALRVLPAAYSTAGEGTKELREPWEKERDRIIKKMEDGKYAFPSIGGEEDVAGISTVQLIRA